MACTTLKIWNKCKTSFLLFRIRNNNTGYRILPGFSSRMFQKRGQFYNSPCRSQYRLDLNSIYTHFATPDPDHSIPELSLNPTFQLQNSILNPFKTWTALKPTFQVQIPIASKTLLLPLNILLNSQSLITIVQKNRITVRLHQLFSLTNQSVFLS
jgi:hypothetical protein